MSEPELREGRRMTRYQNAIRKRAYRRLRNSLLPANAFAPCRRPRPPFVPPKGTVYNAGKSQLGYPSREFFEHSDGVWRHFEE